MLFQVMKRNDDGTIKLEYPIFRTMDLSIPLDSNGNELRGNDLLTFICDSISGEDTVQTDDIDPLLSTELGLSRISPITPESGMNQIPVSEI